MKAVISVTNDDNYLFFLPIVTWCWNQLQIETICFTPASIGEKEWLATSHSTGSFVGFKCPPNKEATYAQCSRLFAAALDNVSKDEILITSDVDMAVFKIPPYYSDFTIYGSDLVPENQFPMCYAAGKGWIWHKLMDIRAKSYQQCLDELLGSIDCENMRGNYWGKDQQTLFEKTNGFATRTPRARPGTQFASNRVDRDDINWRAYLGPDLFDAHLWRPGYTDENFANILELLKAQYPKESFKWLEYFREQYIKLL